MRHGVRGAGSPSDLGAGAACRAARLAGWAALLIGLVLPATACFCGPGPSGPPAQETCDPSGMTYEGITGVTVTSVEVVSGVQGGSHTEIRFSARGATLPTCAAYRLFVGDASLVSGTIRGAVGDGEFLSRPIILFPADVRPYSVEVFGVRSAPFGAPADAGPLDAASSDAPEDAASQDAGDGGGEVDASGADGG
jgi:hypothetical protein